DHSQPGEYPGAREPSTGKRLANTRGRRTRHDPAIGKPTGQRGKTGPQQVSATSDPGHVVHGEVPFAHQIKRKPGNEEIVDIIAAEEPDAGAPGRSQPQKLE